MFGALPLFKLGREMEIERRYVEILSETEMMREMYVCMETGGDEDS
jgi:hypothetical protein